MQHIVAIVGHGDGGIFIHADDVAQGITLSLDQLQVFHVVNHAAGIQFGHDRPVVVRHYG